MFNRIFNFEQNRSIKSGMPQMDETLTGWESPINLIKVVQSIVDGDIETTEQIVQFLGVIQPLKDEALQSIPEGLRSWRWLWIHAKAGTLNLQTNDKIKFNDIRYKVMNVKDYSLNGFIEYQLCEDYQ